MTDIHGANNEVLGVSADSPFSLSKWAEQEGYSFTLLSDYGKETIAAYGVMYPDLIGLKGVPMRSAFIVGRDGNIAYQEVLDDAKQLPDIDALVDRMKAMG